MIIDFFSTRPQFLVFVSFLIGLACMPVVRKIAREKHFVVKPNKRTSHVGEIPNIGGLDICFSFLMAYLLFEVDTSLIRQSQFILIGVLTITMIGFTDDILDLSPLSKLMGETLAGIALIGFADIRLTNLHGFLGIGEIGMVPSYLLSFFVLIVIVNAINLIDGIDGLASGLGILYCACFGVYFHLCGHLHWAAFAYSMIGSLAVFFIYNVFGRKKRKIFMGDSGSLLLGYILTAFVFHFCEINAYHEIPEVMACKAAPAVAICILSIPLFDTLRVMLTRIKHKQSPFLPDKNHIHHLLLRIGLNHLQTTCLLLSISVLFVGLAYIGRNWNILLLISVNLFLCILLTWILWRIVDNKTSKQNDQH